MWIGTVRRLAGPTVPSTAEEVQPKTGSHLVGHLVDQVQPNPDVLLCRVAEAAGILGEATVGHSVSRVVGHQSPAALIRPGADGHVAVDIDGREGCHAVDRIGRVDGIDAVVSDSPILVQVGTVAAWLVGLAVPAGVELTTGTVVAAGSVCTDS